jgi:hypothetical protein
MDARRVNSVAGKRRCGGERDRRCGDKDQFHDGSFDELERLMPWRVRNKFMARRRVLRCMPPQANLLLFLANAAAVPQSVRGVRHAGLSAPETLHFMSVVY